MDFVVCDSGKMQPDAPGPLLNHCTRLEDFVTTNPGQSFPRVELLCDAESCNGLATYIYVRRAIPHPGEPLCARCDDHAPVPDTEWVRLWVGDMGDADGRARIRAELVAKADGDDKYWRTLTSRIPAKWPPGWRG